MTEAERIAQELDKPLALRRHIDEAAVLLRQQAAEIERLRDFAEEYIEAWDEGMAADGYLLRKAREALGVKHD